MFYSQIEHSKIYGPLWKSKYGPLVVVNVASAELIEEVLRQEGRHPVRTDMTHWRSYRELRNQAHGPLTEYVRPQDKLKTHTLYVESQHTSYVTYIMTSLKTKYLVRPFRSQTCHSFQSDCSIFLIYFLHSLCHKFFFKF